MQPCTICKSPHRHAVDIALVNEVPVRKIAKQYGFSVTAVQHHKKPENGKPSHIKKPIQAAKDAEVIEQGKDLQERIDEIYNTAFGLVKMAVAQQDPKAAGYNLSNAIKITELMAERPGATIAITNNVSIKPDLSKYTVDELRVLRALAAKSQGDRPGTSEAKSA